jgi:hypothetical protein
MLIMNLKLFLEKKFFLTPKTADRSINDAKNQDWASFSSFFISLFSVFPIFYSFIYNNYYYGA